MSLADSNLPDEAEWRPQLERLVGKPYAAVHGWFEVNAPMIRAWCQAIGIDAALYLERAEPIAPPSMLQVWTMVDPDGQRGPGSGHDNFYEALDLLTAAGFPGVVAVNCTQTYDRTVRLGERLSFTSHIESVSAVKRTALGTGVFVEQVRTFHSDAGDRVATMRFRLFKFRAAKKRPAPAQPGISEDTAFFWNGLEAGELRIQRCATCHRLRHPPGPACPACHSLDWDSIVASGRGHIHSFITAHHPKSPSHPIPNPIVLVTLDEGTRVVGGFDGDPAEMEIGAAVALRIARSDGSVPLPRFARAD